ARRNRATEFHPVTLILLSRNSVHGEQLVILARGLTLTDGDAQTIVRRPILARPIGMRANDVLLDEIVGHCLSGSERGFAGSFPQLFGFGEGWKFRFRWIRAAAIGFFQSVNQRSIVAALGGD